MTRKHYYALSAETLIKNLVFSARFLTLCDLSFSSVSLWSGFDFFLEKIRVYSFSFAFIRG